MEKTVKVNWEGKEVDVVLKQLTWGDTKKAMEDSIVLKEYNGQPMQFRNTVLLDDLKILVSIKEAPFEVTMGNLDKLSELDRYKLATIMNLLDGDDASSSKSD